MPIFKNLFGPSGPEQNQGQEEYINIREQQGSNGRLFWGELINQQGIEGGGKTTHLLIYDDDKGEYRQPTEKELEEILREIEKNREK